MSKETDVQIPLSIFQRGERTQIGMVSVAADGSGQFQVAKEHWPLLKHLFQPNVGEISIGPAWQTPKAKPTRVQASTTDH